MIRVQGDRHKAGGRKEGSGLKAGKEEYDVVRQSIQGMRRIPAEHYGGALRAPPPPEV